MSVFSLKFKHVEKYSEKSLHVDTSLYTKLQSLSQKSMKHL